MTVAELISELQTMPQDSLVILQKDAEGNGYSPLEGADDDCVYEADSTWSGEVHGPEGRAEGYGADGVPCVVLHPVN